MKGSRPSKAEVYQAFDHMDRIRTFWGCTHNKFFTSSEMDNVYQAHTYHGALTTRRMLNLMREEIESKHQVLKSLNQNFDQTSPKIVVEWIDKILKIKPRDLSSNCGLPPNYLEKAFDRKSKENFDYMEAKDALRDYLSYACLKVDKELKAWK